MNTENIKILKNLETGIYYVTKESNIEDGFLHDCYSRYGIPVSNEEACDYCLANTECDMKQDIERELRENFDISDDVEIEIDYDGTVKVDDEENEEYSEFAKKYNEENLHYTEARYFNYWDGRNWQSIIIWEEFYDTEWEEVDDDEEVVEITSAVEKFDPYIANGAGKAEKIDGFEVFTSIWQDNPWMCRLERL